MLMSESKEIDMGKKAHGDIIKTFGVFNDEKLEGWLTEKGKEMGKVTQRSNLDYSFTVLDSPVVNAFAVPGGYVYFTRGILGYFNNEAQFAGVLAHELGHINYRHSASQYSKAQLANMTLLIGSIFSEEFNRYAQLASLGASFLFLKFSRDNEREADRAGVEYSSAVGYDATEMSVFFHTLERLQPKGGSLPSWASTHPDPGDRVKATLNMSRKYQKDHPGDYVIRRNEYLDVVDGMIFGENPHQGYVKNDAFIHPDMKFMFPVPAGWKLTNNPTEVRMAPEDQKALLVFTFAGGESPRAAASKFTSENSITVTDERMISINGMSCLRTIGTMPGDESPVAVMSYFIDKEGTIFAFHGLAASAQAGSYSDTFERSANGFRVVTDQSLLDVSSKNIHLRTAAGRKTFEDNLEDFGVPAENHEELSVINGFDLSQVIPVGTRMKIIE